MTKQTSIALDARLLHHVGPFVEVATRGLFEVFGRSADRYEAQRLDTRDAFRGGDDAGEFVGKLLHDLLRSRSRHEDAEPAFDLEAGIAQLAHRRHVGHRLATLFTADRQRPELASLDLGMRR